MFNKALLATAVMLAMSATAQAKTFKVGMGDPMDSDQGALAQRFEELVEDLSDGEMQVELFPDGQLGSETGMIQDTRIGKLDFALIGVGNLTPYAPRSPCPMHCVAMRMPSRPPPARWRMNGTRSPRNRPASTSSAGCIPTSVI